MSSNRTMLGVLALEDRLVPAGQVLPERYVVIGADAGTAPVVTIVDAETDQVVFTFEAYGKTVTTGVQVDLGDFSGDGVADIITSPGVGGGPHVRIFDGVTGQQLQTALGNFFAGDPAARQGADVSTWDFTGDGLDDLFAVVPTDAGVEYKLFNGFTGQQTPVAVGQFITEYGEAVLMICPLKNDASGSIESELLIHRIDPFPGRPQIWSGGVRRMTDVELTTAWVNFEADQPVKDKPAGKLDALDPNKAHPDDRRHNGTFMNGGWGAVDGDHRLTDQEIRDRNLRRQDLMLQDFDSVIVLFEINHPHFTRTIADLKAARQLLARMRDGLATRAEFVAFENILKSAYRNTLNQVDAGMGIGFAAGLVSLIDPTPASNLVAAAAFATAGDYAAARIELIGAMIPFGFEKLLYWRRLRRLFKADPDAYARHMVEYQNRLHSGLPSNPPLTEAEVAAAEAAAAARAGVAPAAPIVYSGPSPRHRSIKVNQKTVAKPLNTVVEPGIDVAADKAAINQGLAQRIGDTFVINGRTYGIERNGTLYPISGPGFHTLDRGGFRALGVFNEFGDTPRAAEIMLLRGLTQESIDAGRAAWMAGQAARKVDQR